MIRSDADIGRVALVGAGPGDPGLITVRGLALLRAADVVVYDRLIGHELLDEAPAHAERIDAGKAPGRHTLPQEEINSVIVRHALAGRRVVRLKGGDPFIFGRGWEELVACRDAGVPCEVVPGISSAIAGPAAAGIPVTARGLARTFAIVTPQSESGAEPVSLDYDALSRLDTVSILMARGRLEEVAQGFLDAGRSPSTPAAVVQDATLPTQRSVVGTLSDIASRADAAGLASPAVVVIGATAALAVALRPAATGPLAGRRIVVTRPRTASPELISMLRDRGAHVIDAPLIRIEYTVPADADVVRDRHDWTVFTSLHGVRGYQRVLSALGLDARVLACSRVAAVGPKTAAALHEMGIRADLTPAIHRAEALVDAIPALAGVGGSRVLFPCGTLARDELRSGLRRAGMTVHELAVYDTLPATPPASALDAIHRGVDAFLLYCPSGVRSAAHAGIDLSAATLACIGPTTADAARALGLEPQVVAERHTDAGLLDALAAFLSTAGPLAGARA